MTGELTKGAVLFADLAGSTSLYETLGNVAARQAVQAILERMASTAEERRGHVIKTLGDAILAWFPSADDAAQAAITLQQNARRDSFIPVRVGFHYGEIIQEPSDIFGDVVNVAARLTNTARSGEILTSAEAVSCLSQALAGATREVDFERFKGKMQSMRVYELQWEDGRDVTRIGHKRPVHEAAQEAMRDRVLRLEVGRRKFVLTSQYMPHTLGRNRRAGTCIDSPLVSRAHAQLDFRHGKFVLTDHSINGTYVTPQGGAEVFLCRESMPLFGRGTISLGGTAERNPEVTLRYNCE